MMDGDQGHVFKAWTVYWSAELEEYGASSADQAQTTGRSLPRQTRMGEETLDGTSLAMQSLATLSLAMLNRIHQQHI